MALASPFVARAVARPFADRDRQPTAAGRRGARARYFVLTAFCACSRRVAAALRDYRLSGAQRRVDAATAPFPAKNAGRGVITASEGCQVCSKLGCRVAQAEGGLAMNTTDLDRLGDEIAELSANLDAATARLLDLIGEFDARGGWGNGFRSCAAWLSWRVGFAPGAAREHVRVARALGTLPRLSHALARGELSYAKVR